MLLLQMQLRLTLPQDGPGQMYRFHNANGPKLLLGEQSPQGEREAQFRGRQQVWTLIRAAPTCNPIILPAKHEPTTTHLHHNLTKGRRGIPSTSLELTENPTASLPNSPEPLQPGDNAATIIWHYKHSTAALIGNVKACNTIFRYDYQIQEVLDWQRISKPKRNTNATSQAQYKVQLQPVTIGKWALSLFQNTGLKAAKQSPFQEAKRQAIAAKFAGARSAESIQKEKKTMMICHNVIRVNAPTIGIV